MRQSRGSPVTDAIALQQQCLETTVVTQSRRECRHANPLHEIGRQVNLGNGLVPGKDGCNRDGVRIVDTVLSQLNVLKGVTLCQSVAEQTEVCGIVHQAHIVQTEVPNVGVLSQRPGNPR